jgi:hypothetical protein
MLWLAPEASLHHTGAHGDACRGQGFDRLATWAALMVRLLMFVPWMFLDNDNEASDRRGWRRRRVSITQGTR